MINKKTVWRAINYRKLTNQNKKDYTSWEQHQTEEKTKTTKQKQSGEKNIWVNQQQTERIIKLTCESSTGKRDWRVWRKRGKRTDRGTGVEWLREALGIKDEDHMCAVRNRWAVQVTGTGTMWADLLARLRRRATLDWQSSPGEEMSCDCTFFLFFLVLCQAVFLAKTEKKQESCLNLVDSTECVNWQVFQWLPKSAVWIFRHHKICLK